MAAGDVTSTMTRYATLAAAIAFMSTQNLPLATDTFTLHFDDSADDSEPGTAVGRYCVVKTVRAAA